MTVEANDVLMWLAAFVALWWVIDWISFRQSGEPLPLRRAPLRILADVARKLWRNKTFLAVLLALWLIGAAGFAVQSTVMRLAHLGPMPSAQPMFMRVYGLTDTVPTLLARELPEALPRLQEVPLDTWGTLLLAALLFLAFARIAVAPPPSIGEETARRLRWPLGVLVAGIVAHIAALAVPRTFLESLGLGGSGIPPLRALPWTIGTMVLLPVLLAPMHTLLWRLVLEIVRDGVWSFKSSMAALAESWLPVTLVLLIANGLRVLAIIWNRPLGYVYLAALVLLALAPFAIVDRREGLGGAFVRTWRLIRQKPVDVIAFGLRFTLLFAVLGGLVALVEPHPEVSWAAWYAPLLQVVRLALVLLQVAVLAGLYVHLGELLEENDACASCPSTRLTEKLEDLAEEDNERASREARPS